VKIFAKFTLILFLLSGCATPYQPKTSAYGYGYSESQLGENIFSVRFVGSTSDSPEVVSDYAMLRAAEVTLEHGFSHFGIAEAQDKTKISSYTTPVQSSTYVNPYTGYASTSTYGGQTYIGSAPTSIKTIICYRGKPEDDKIVVFDAAFLKDTLRKKYELDKKPEKQK